MLIVNWFSGTKPFIKLSSKYLSFHRRKWVWKCCLWNVGHFVSRPMGQSINYMFENYIMKIAVASPRVQWDNIFNSSNKQKKNIQLIFPCTQWPHFADDIFRCIFMKEKFCILMKISLKFGPKGLTDNNLAPPNRWQDIIWTNTDPIDPCIYAALGGEELRPGDTYMHLWFMKLLVACSTPSH